MGQILLPSNSYAPHRGKSASRSIHARQRVQFLELYPRMTPVLPSVAMAPFTDLLHSLADHSKGAEQMIGFADWRVFDLIPCLAPVRKILEVERILARLLLKSTAEVGGCPRFFLLDCR